MAHSDHAAPTVKPAPACQNAGAPAVEPARRSDPQQSRVAAVLFIAALAFLLGSFPARNSDVWMHLAAGRQLARGPEYFSAVPHFAENPPHATWLYDLACYAIYSAVGGPGLVIVKALLVVALAVVLLRLSAAGAPLWIATFCTFLGLLTISRRVPLQPVIVSYLCAALAVWLIRPGREAKPRQASDAASPARRVADLLRGLWPLLVLFLLWANLDRWVVIGLGIVGLTWLGRILDEPASARGALAGRLFLSFVLVSAVCLCSPSLLGAFTAPADLEWFQTRSDSVFARQVTSPFQSAYLRSVGFTPAGLAYFPLLGLGLGSFFLSRANWRWQRVLPWLGLAVLSAFEVRCVPFFAIVGGPVLAWNLGDYAARRAAPASRRRGSPLLEPLSWALACGLLVCAWAGWLQGPPFEPRRWDVEVAPAIERAADTHRASPKGGRP